MIRVLELFGGIGAFSKALERQGIEHEIVDYVEIDKFAVQSFNAIHNTHFKPQDITKWDKDIDVDVIMHGSPCQDFSAAGKGAGGDEGSGTRSSLMYETLRIVEKLKPKYVIWENVKNILSKKHKHNFDAYLNRMRELGYNNYYQVLNAKNYGIPQNRERVFTISILDDTKCSFSSGGHAPMVPDFEFPLPSPLNIRLKDILEDQVDESFYLSDEQVKKNKMSTYNQNRTRIQEGDVSQTLCARDWKDLKYVKVGDLDIRGQDCIKRVYSPEGVSPTLTTMGGGNREPKIVAMRGRNPDNPSDRATGVPTVQRLEVNAKGVTNTLTSVQKDNMVIEPNWRIRKLTPLECWRLMGFGDEDFRKAQKAGISNTQLYKQAGNSIVVNVLESILNNLFINRK